VGFLAGAGLLALITAIVGSAAGSNPAVILLDITETRRRIPVSGPAVRAGVPVGVDV
jgi:hypothetical protein